MHGVTRTLWEPKTETALSKGLLFSRQPGPSTFLREKAFRKEKYPTPSVNLIFPIPSCRISGFHFTQPRSTFSVTVWKDNTSFVVKTSQLNLKQWPLTKQGVPSPRDCFEWKEVIPFPASMPSWTHGSALPIYTTRGNRRETEWSFRKAQGSRSPW